MDIVEQTLTVPAAAKAGKVIQRKLHASDAWEDTTDFPFLNFTLYHYRVKPEPPVPPGDLTYEEASELDKQGVELEHCYPGASNWIPVVAGLDIALAKDHAYRRKPKSEPTPVVPSMVVYWSNYEALICLKKDEGLLLDTYFFVGSSRRTLEYTRLESSDAFFHLAIGGFGITKKQPLERNP